MNIRGVALLPLTRVFASTTRFANTRHRYEKHLILAYLVLQVAGYSLYYVRNPRHSNFSFPNLGPLGNLSYDIVQETLSKMEMLSDASRLTVTYMSSTLYSPSIWAPGPGAMFKQVPGYSVDYLRNTWHGNLSSPKSRPLGTITNDIFRKTHFKMKENAASCLSPHPPVL